ncbi:TetR/AcrR family transcriptional regulator [Pendulispora brunnea]|uniref:TetR/AcrR family transcriptional regulator n=1 Tax=Pendulispora brunnea TaxID=2905690 RepID=A0ABZ2K1L5_9BACT
MQGRSAEIVELVLQNAAEEFGRNGYAGMRVDEIAARSGVNKTTIYRRWPTKDDLVVAALRHISPYKQPPNTGSLREDLLGLLRGIVEMASTPKGLAIFRAIQIERGQPAFEPVLTRLKTDMAGNRQAIFDRAILRGELPVTTDSQLVGEVCFAAVFLRIVTVGQKVDEPFLESVVDMIVAGAKVVGAKNGQPISGQANPASSASPASVE